MATFFQDLLEMFRSRVKNVLYSTFVISWILVNWRLVFILLFSNDAPEEVLRHIDGLYSCKEKWIYFLGWPTALTALHLFALSRLSEWVYAHWLGHIERLLDTKKKIEGSGLLTLKDSQRIRSENAHLKVKIEEREKEHMEDISSLTNEIKTMKGDGTRGENKRLKHENNELKEEISSLKDDKDKKKESRENVNIIKTFVMPDPSKLPKFSDILDGFRQSEWNVLEAKDYHKIIQIYGQGGTQYDFLRELNAEEHQKAKNFNNISKPKGISLNIAYNRISRTRYIDHIKWDRKKFQDEP